MSPYTGAFPSMTKELDDQDEATHVHMKKTKEEVQGQCPAFDDDLEFDGDHIKIEEDDCIIMAMVDLVDPKHFICTSSMVSGHLAEASTKNLLLKGFHKLIPTTLHSYEDVFSEIAFDTLSEHQKWDHTIKLEHEPSRRLQKVYPMTLTEQTEMDALLEEALATGHIRQLKSLLGAPVFFIKRKNGKLCLSRTIKHSMQSCEQINTSSVRGHPPFPLLPLLLTLPGHVNMYSLWSMYISDHTRTTVTLL
jgi:hypothetical protein